MDITSRFSLTDFMAYLFPGIIAAAGLYMLLLLTPLSDTLTNITADLATGIFFLVFSFIFGVLLSGYSELLVRSLKLRKKEQLKGSILLPGFQNEITKAFKNIFPLYSNNEVEWTAYHFYVCRSIVFEYMPNATNQIQRQNSLRQLRMNMIPAILIWLFVGIGWGIRNINSDSALWGQILLITTITLSVLIISMLINRMNDNEEREVRETLAAFLAGYKTGNLTKKGFNPD